MRTIIDVTNSQTNPVQATKAADLVSKSYQFVSTSNVLSALETFGWTPVSQTAVQPRKTQAHRIGFQKHMVVLENAEYPTIEGLNGDHYSKPQLIIVNSHDRESSLQMMWGMIRMACLNGIIAGRAINTVRLHHNAQMAARLPEAVAQVLLGFDAFSKQAKSLAQTQLTATATQKLIKTVYDARLSTAVGVTKVDYTLPALRRAADGGSDAFSIFNRVQEVAIRGGINYTATQKRRQGDDYVPTEVSKVTRAVKGLQDSVRINELAYQTALELV